MELKINNQIHQVDAPDEMPLLWVLRDLLGKKGTKFGCGQGLCGTCTVHVNGQPMRSCITPVAVAKNSEVTTIEGVDEQGNHPIQIAWRENNVPQCGYCQSGQIMSALNLLSNNSTPTDQDIDSAMSGNICRCGTYPRIKQAIKDAAKVMNQNKGAKS
ncbi:Isoquinoline 1-oxidoreductase [Catenovulum agarivorans DS-2]|uniref:Isoquinoline 1-oxidoreductase n=1 Tax=Catenovulum agarivorans DS-2 TaxID=1328313 RepID=W7Q9X5_9ALTE|nr:(2Fe-2S)-binding protein [Catenovulum agarivorans]EWH08791.1 Isoquinoline 1-oxidoreductase [Catenovulum agarivorans DS-2]